MTAALPLDDREQIIRQVDDLLSMLEGCLRFPEDQEEFLPEIADARAALKTLAPALVDADRLRGALIEMRAIAEEESATERSRIVRFHRVLDRASPSAARGVGSAATEARPAYVEREESRYEVSFFIGPCPEDGAEALVEAIMALGEFAAVHGGGVGTRRLYGEEGTSTDRSAMRDLAGLVLELTSQDCGPGDCVPFTGWCVDLARDVLRLLDEAEA